MKTMLVEWSALVCECSHFLPTCSENNGFDWTPHCPSPSPLPPSSTLKGTVPLLYNLECAWRIKCKAWIGVCYVSDITVGQNSSWTTCSLAIVICQLTALGECEFKNAQEWQFGVVVCSYFGMASRSPRILGCVCECFLQLSLVFSRAHVYAWNRLTAFSWRMWNSKLGNLSRFTGYLLLVQISVR